MKFNVDTQRWCTERLKTYDGVSTIKEFKLALNEYKNCFAVDINFAKQFDVNFGGKKARSIRWDNHNRCFFVTVEGCFPFPFSVIWIYKQGKAFELAMEPRDQAAWFKVDESDRGAVNPIALPKQFREVAVRLLRRSQIEIDDIEQHFES